MESKVDIECITRLQIKERTELPAARKGGFSTGEVRDQPSPDSAVKEPSIALEAREYELRYLQEASLNLWRLFEFAKSLELAAEHPALAALEVSELERERGTTTEEADQ